jgi:hypothetical protein
MTDHQVNNTSQTNQQPSLQVISVPVFIFKQQSFFRKRIKINW